MLVGDLVGTLCQEYIPEGKGTMTFLSKNIGSHMLVMNDPVSMDYFIGSLVKVEGSDVRMDNSFN